MFISFNKTLDASDFFIQDKKFFVDFILENKYQKYRPLFTLGVILFCSNMYHLLNHVYDGKQNRYNSK